MPRYARKLDALSATWRWLRTSRHVMAWAFGVSALVVIICWLAGYHHTVAATVEHLATPESKPWWVTAYDVVSPYLRLMALLGSVLFSLSLVRCYPNLRQLVLPTAVAFGYLATWALVEEAHSHWVAGAMNAMGEPSSPFFYGLKIVMMLIIILSPPIMLFWYSRQSLLDRYTLKNFLQPFLFCLLAFASLWMLMDIINNMKEFQEAKVPVGVMIGFYFDLAPYIYVLATPAALLLGVLYALTRMSRSNEIVSMLTAGRSLWQVLKPVFVVSAYIALIGMAMNYHWAPRGESRRDTLLQASAEDKKMASVAQTNIMYCNETEHRTWYVGAMPFDPGNDRIIGLEVRQMDEKGRLVTSWFGRTGRWYAENNMWSFTNGVKINYRNGAANEIVPFRKAPQGTRMDVTDWPETPWSIISSSLLPDNLGVSELVSFLNSTNTKNEDKRAAFRTHLAHRFAYPWQCLVLVLMAAPLGVSFSRRGAIGGIAISVFIFFGLMFLNNFFISLGKNGHMPAWLAVWMPHLIIGCAALVLFDMRANNRDVPKFDPVGWARSLWQFILNFTSRRPATHSR